MRLVLFGSVLATGITFDAVHAGIADRERAAPWRAHQVLGLPAPGEAPVQTAALPWEALRIERMHGFAGLVRPRADRPWRLMEEPEERIWEDDPDANVA